MGDFKAKRVFYQQAAKVKPQTKRMAAIGK
jgi:hypothetical protein